MPTGISIFRVKLVPRALPGRRDRLAQPARQVRLSTSKNFWCPGMGPRGPNPDRRRQILPFERFVGALVAAAAAAGAQPRGLRFLAAGAAGAVRFSMTGTPPVRSALPKRLPEALPDPGALAQLSMPLLVLL